MKKHEHFESVSHGTLNKESAGKTAGNGIGGKGTFEKINTEGMEQNLRQDFGGIDVVDGADSSEDIGTGGYGGLTKVGGSHMNVFVCSIVVKRAMITASSIAYHDCSFLLRREILHFNGAHDESPHQFSLKASHTRRVESCCERRFESRVGESLIEEVFH